MKRFLFATFFGLCMGGLCAAMTFGLMGRTFAIITLLWILLNRTVMGYVIGISSLRLHWALHGVLQGVIVGSIFSYFLFMDWGMGWKAWLTPIGNALFGFLIELFTTVVCKQPAPARLNAANPAAMAGA